MKFLPRLRPLPLLMICLALGACATPADRRALYFPSQPNGPWHDYERRQLAEASTGVPTGPSTAPSVLPPTRPPASAPPPPASSAPVAPPPPAATPAAAVPAPAPTPADTTIAAPVPAT